MKHTTRFLILGAAVLGAAGLATAGWAYWSTTGSGTATALVGTWKNDTTTAVVSSGSPSLVGQQVTYTATVTPDGSGAPTGNVAFLDDASSIAGCGGASGVALNGLTATCTQTYASVGTHSITAQYLGDADFNPSPVSAAISQAVNKGTTSNSLSVTGSPAVYGAENAVVFSSSVTTAAGPATGTVAIKQGVTTLCSITLPATTCSPTPAALNASPTAYSIIAVYSGDGNHMGSTSSTQSLVINKATPLITWNVPAPITYGTALGATQLNASANIPGTMAYNPTPGTILPAGDHQLNVTFTPTDTTNYSSASAGVATLTVNRVALTITASSASMTYGGTPPTITASYSGFVNGQNSTALSTQPTCTTTATSNSAAGSAQSSSCSGASASNYTISYVTGTITVNKASQTISFTQPGPGTVGTPASLSASATSGLTVSFASTTMAVCTVSGTTATYLTAGTCTINASQAGNTNWNPAAPVARSFTVTVAVPAGLTFSSCSAALTANCSTPGIATVTLEKSNQSGVHTWSARVSLTDGNGNVVINNGPNAITVNVTNVNAGATITFSSGTALTVPVGASASTNSFTYSNAAVSKGGGSDTVTASSPTLSQAVGNISW